MGARKEARDAKYMRDELAREQEADPHSSCLRIEAQMQDKIFRLEEKLQESEALKAELMKAKGLIARLRAENQVLRDEKKLFLRTVDNCKRHIAISGNAARKYAVCLVKSQLEKARLL